MTQPSALPGRVLEDVGIGPDPPDAAAAIHGEILVPDRRLPLGDLAGQLDQRHAAGGDAPRGGRRTRTPRPGSGSRPS